jgi:hypothetical protein
LSESSIERIVAFIDALPALDDAFPSPVGA